MTFYVTDQNVVILVLTLFGAACGFLRDILNVKRHFVKTGAVAGFAEDILYCAVFTALFHMIVFVTNYGYVRWYEFVSVLLGFALYRFLIGDIVLKVLISLTAFILGTVSKILAIVFKPFAKIFRLLAGPVKKIAIKVLRHISERRMKLYSDTAVKKLIAYSKKGFYTHKGKEAK